jgi:hypothetical protein
MKHRKLPSSPEADGNTILGDEHLKLPASRFED